MQYFLTSDCMGKDRELADVVTIGGEGCDIVMEDLAPGAVCSITLNDDVLSLVAHREDVSVRINKKEIDCSRMFFLEVGDRIFIGEVTFSIRAQEQAQEQEPEAEPIKLKVEKQHDAKQDFKKSKTKKRKEKTLKIKLPIAGAWWRVSAFVLDLLIVAVIIFQLSHSKEFDFALEDLTQAIQVFAMTLYGELTQALPSAIAGHLTRLEDFLSSLAQEQAQLVKVAFQAFCLYFLMRAVFSLILGVSLGQALSGIRSHGHFLLKRILGPIRSLVELILFPLFWLTKAPTLFSRPSLEELMSGTRLVAPSFLMSIFSSTFSFAAIVSAAMFLPLWHNGELVKALPFREAQIEKTQIRDEKQQVVYSNTLGVGILLEEDRHLLPWYEIGQENGKRRLFKGIAYFSPTETQSLVKVKKLKKVDLGALIKSFVSSHPLAFHYFPHLHKYATDASHTSKNFRHTDVDKDKIILELQRLISISLELDAHDFSGLAAGIESTGPWFYPYLVMRDEILALFEQRVASFQFRTVGDGLHLVADVSRPNEIKERALNLQTMDTGIYEISRAASNPNMHFPELLWEIDENGKAFSHPVSAFIDRDDATSLVIYYLKLGQESVLTNAPVPALTVSIERLVRLFSEYAASFKLAPSDSARAVQILSELKSALEKRDIDRINELLSEMESNN